MKKTKSMTIENNELDKTSQKLPDVNDQRHEKSRGQQESSSFYRNKQKLPNSIKNSMKNYASGTKHKVNESKVKKVMKSIMMNQKFVCMICQCEYQTTEEAKITKCQHSFCQSCLQHYTIYKVGIFQQVFCPQQDCSQILDVQSKFFKRLPKDIQEKYKKVHLFYLASKNPNLRLCPNQHCDEGTLYIIEGVSPTCQKCGKTFCHKCMFPIHEGKCDNNEVDFFENNLHYRQCRKCKTIIELNQGCNHMTCKCSHQFCYICGKDWNDNGHLCTEQFMRIQAERPCDCLNRIDTTTCGGKIIGFFVKILLLPIYLILFLLRWTCYIGFSCILLPSTIMSALCSGVCELCRLAAEKCGSQAITFVLLIFFPIVLLVAWVIALKQIFQETLIPFFYATLTNVIRDTINFFCW